MVVAKAQLMTTKRPLRIQTIRLALVFRRTRLLRSPTPHRDAGTGSEIGDERAYIARTDGAAIVFSSPVQSADIEGVREITRIPPDKILTAPLESRWAD